MTQEHMFIITALIWGYNFGWFQSESIMLGIAGLLLLSPDTTFKSAAIVVIWTWGLWRENAGLGKSVRVAGTFSFFLSAIAILFLGELNTLACLGLGFWLFIGLKKTKAALEQQKSTLKDLRQWTGKLSSRQILESQFGPISTLQPTAEGTTWPDADSKNPNKLADNHLEAS